MTETLTKDEKMLVHMLGMCANKFTTVIMDGPSRDGDLAEMAHHIHVLQNMVLANAAARTYPEDYRVLGGVVQPKEQNPLRVV